ncbi:MAG: hypothetical protein ACYC35_00025 [Pirellulales bacterium]
MSYAQKAIDKIRDLPQDAARVYLWEFPEEDFAAYLAMPDTPRLESHGHYLAAIAAIQADVEQRGTHVARVRVPVAAVVAELAKHNWPNDTQHRATVIGELGATVAGSN